MIPLHEAIPEFPRRRRLPDEDRLPAIEARLLALEIALKSLKALVERHHMPEDG